MKPFLLNCQIHMYIGFFAFNIWCCSLSIYWTFSTKSISIDSEGNHQSAGFAQWQVQRTSLSTPSWNGGRKRYKCQQFLTLQMSWKQVSRAPDKCKEYELLARFLNSSLTKYQITTSANFTKMGIVYPPPNCNKLISTGCIVTCQSECKAIVYCSVLIYFNCVKSSKLQNCHRTGRLEADFLFILHNFSRRWGLE